MAHLPRLATDAQQFTSLLQGFDKTKFKCFAFVTCCEYMDYFARGPARLVFQFANDRTVYCIAQTDLYPEFNALDFYKWFLVEDMVCTTVIPLEWYDIEYALHHPFNSTIYYYAIPGSFSMDHWEAIVRYTGIFFPFSLPIRPAWV